MSVIVCLLIIWYPCSVLIFFSTFCIPLDSTPFTPSYSLFPVPTVHNSLVHDSSSQSCYWARSFFRLPILTLPRLSFTSFHEVGSVDYSYRDLPSWIRFLRLHRYSYRPTSIPPFRPASDSEIDVEGGLLRLSNQHVVLTTLLSSETDPPDGPFRIINRYRSGNSSVRPKIRSWSGETQLLPSYSFYCRFWKRLVSPLFNPLDPVPL